MDIGDSTHNEYIENQESEGDMTKEELSQIKIKSKEINVLRQKIQDLYWGDDSHYVSDKVTGSSAHFPYSQRSFRIEGFEQMSEECIKKRNDLAARLSNKVGELCDLLNKAYGYIDSIPDGQIRLILIYKYVDGKTEEEIAEEIELSTRTVQRKFK
ncbi:MAG: polymerase, sigma-24 subunit, subfamily, partial [Neobacillus sp.]|nr:polymerase, sigma-24 subunit, subfamily [Neobacillus sp.]